MLYLTIVNYLGAQNDDLKDQSRAVCNYFPSDFTIFRFILPLEIVAALPNMHNYFIFALDQKLFQK